jgi:ketosteroid isomerase-like protein
MMNPAEVVAAVYAAVGEGDIESAVSMLADDAVLVLVPPPEGQDSTFVGKEKIGAWLEELASMNVRFEFSDISVVGNTASMKLAFYGDFFENMGISPAEFDGAAVVQEGLWKSVSWVFTPEFRAKMETAIEDEASKR